MRIKGIDNPTMQQCKALVQGGVITLSELPNSMRNPVAEALERDRLDAEDLARVEAEKAKEAPKAKKSSKKEK